MSLVMLRATNCPNNPLEKNVMYCTAYNWTACFVKRTSEPYRKAARMRD